MNTTDPNALRVGDGFDGGNEPATVVVLANMGHAYGYGTTGSAILTATNGIPSLDLNGYEVFLANGYGNGAWDGTVTLTYDPPVPAKLTNVLGGTTLSLSWPAGWRLQQQTNGLSVGLGNNWVTVTDGSAGSTNIPLDKIRPTTFYRLVYP